MSVELETDAFPGRRFAGAVERIAPVFRESSRQARVEVQVDNPTRELKPGMFIRVTVELLRVQDALTVPRAAITERGGETGVFEVDEQNARVTWRPVDVGVHEDDRVEVAPRPGDALSGVVVTLGQHLIDDGDPVSVAARLGGVAAESVE